MQNQNYVMRSEPLRNQYSPNNNTNQNIDIYKRSLAQNSTYNATSYLGSGEQLSYNNANYNNYPYNNNLPIQYSISNIDNYSSLKQGEINNNMINNNSNIKDMNLEYNNLALYNNLNNNKNNNMNNNINNNNDNNKSNGNNNKNNKESKDDKIEDPDELIFRGQKENEKENSKKDEGSELSEDSENNSDNELEFTDQLLAQYEKVKRVKNKWKVSLKGCVVQTDNKEYICGKVHGELEREW